MIEADRAVTKDLKWIFRDQPSIDVGIDAFIEKCEGGDPVGKFLAVQVKSGEGNFRLRKDKFVHYLSNVHRNYWTNLNIPIILVAYLPSRDECYWKQINDKNLSKTKTGWKIEIPFENIFDKRAEKSLDKIFSYINTEDVFSEIYSTDEEFRYSQYYSIFEQSIVCLKQIRTISKDLSEYISRSTKKNSLLVDQGMNGKSPEFRSNVKQQSMYIANSSKRLMGEAELFSASFSEELYTLEKFLYMEITNNSGISSVLMEGLRETPAMFDKSMSILKDSQTAVIGFNPPFSKTKAALKMYAESLDLLHSEYSSAKDLVCNLVQKETSVT